MVTPLDKPTQLWLLKKAFVSLGVMESAEHRRDLEFDSSGVLVDPHVAGRQACARISRHGEWVRVELLKAKTTTEVPVS